MKAETLGHKVQDLSKVQTFRLRGLGFRVKFRLKVQGLGIMVHQGFGYRKSSDLDFSGNQQTTSFLKAQKIAGKATLKNCKHTKIGYNRR